jgi:hypothetical protein
MEHSVSLSIQGLRYPVVHKPWTRQGILKIGIQHFLYFFADERNQLNPVPLSLHIEESKTRAMFIQQLIDIGYPEHKVFMLFGDLFHSAA